MTTPSITLPPTSLPDVNRETYPFAIVQENLDKAAFLNLFAIPEAKQSTHFLADPDDWFGLNGGYGLVLTSSLHRFDSTYDVGLVLKPEIGEHVGNIRMRCLIGPDSADWKPGSEPSPRLFDPWRSQRFSTIETYLEFGSSRSGFRGYCVGRTYPTTIEGRPQTIVCAIGNLDEGFGKLEGLVGSFAMHGALTPELGFVGNVTVRIVDPDERVVVKPRRIDGLVPISSELQSSVERADCATYIVMRGEKETPGIRTEYGAPPGPGLVSLVTPAILRSARYGVRSNKHGELHSDLRAGSKFATLQATVVLDLLASPGTPENPNDFSTTNVYTFVDRRDREVGKIIAKVETGKSFDLKFPKAPGQPGMRYAGFGPILEGTGVFEGAQGTLIVNSAIGVTPHALSMLNVLRIVDPIADFQAPLRRRSRRSRPRVTIVTRASTPTESDERGNNLANHPAHQDGRESLPGKPSLPDINHETYPFDQVLRWLDQSAILNLYSVPCSTSNGTIIDAKGKTVGFSVTEILHHFDVTLQAIAAGDAVTSINTLGDRLGTFSHRWMFIADDFHAFPSRQPPPTCFDPTRSQRFVMLDSNFTSHDGKSGFCGFGTGRTYPSIVAGRREVTISAIGDVQHGFGQFKDSIGTYTYCGVLTEELGYRGNVLFRIADPENKFSPQRRFSGRPTSDVQIEPDVAYLVYRGQKRDSSTKTKYTFDDIGNVNGLALTQELRTVQLDVASNGMLVTRATPGRVIGNMSANVLFNILDPGAPGTSLSPIPFRSINRFAFTDPSGKEIGSFQVTGGEGRTFNHSLPQGPGQNALRFGAFGPLVNGTGVFAGATGMMTDNSVVGVAPHATSTLYVVRLSNSQEAKVTPHAYKENNPELAPSDPFSHLASKMEHHKEQYARWRDGFRKCANVLGETISKVFNDRRSAGVFPGLPMDPNHLALAFASPVKDFDPDRFDRYGGAAHATHRTYELSTLKEVSQPAPLYSIWERKTFRAGKRYVKRITGSFTEFIQPDSLPPLSSKKVDLILNAYDPDVGVTSWIDIYQRGESERASVGYALPHHDEVLWMVKDLSRDGRPLNDNVFMASHEWKRRIDGRTQYLMVGIFFEINFDKSQIQVHGDTFWRELFQEE